MASYNTYKMSLWVKYGISWWQIVYTEVIKSQNHPTNQYTRRMSNIYYPQGHLVSWLSVYSVNSSYSLQYKVLTFEIKPKQGNIKMLTGSKMNNFFLLEISTNWVKKLLLYKIPMTLSPVHSTFSYFFKK